MSNGLSVAPGLTLPLDTVTSTCGILGKKGSGKTTTAVRMAEEMFAAGLQTVIIDPLDVWWGLRSSRDGSAPGYPITVLGGGHADVPLEGNSGEVVAEFVVENTASVILSLRHLSMSEQRRVVADFGRRLYELKGREESKTPLHLFIDEADEYVPQRLGPDTAVVFGAIDRLVRRGRSSGIGVTLISQRAAAINKDVLTQIDTLIAMRTVGPQDRKALETWVEAHDTEGQAKEFLSSLASLSTGEGWIWSPGFLDVFRRVKFSDRRTFDSSATPKAGAAVAAPKRIAAVDLDQLRATMAETIERQKADDPRELRKRISDLERGQPIVDTAAIEAAAAKRGYHEGYLAALRMLASEIEQMRDDAGQFDGDEEDDEEEATDPTPPVRPSSTRRVETKAPERGLESPAHETSRPVRETTGAGTKLPEGERAVLTAIAQHRNGVDRQQISILTGYKRSSRDTYLQRLRQRDFVSIAGDRIAATAAGVGALGNFTPLPTGRKLQEYWLSRLPEGERKILDILISLYPRTVSREQISSATDYKRSSRDTYIQRLSARKLVAVSAIGITASRELF